MFRKLHPRWVSRHNPIMLLKRVVCNFDLLTVLVSSNYVWTYCPPFLRLKTLSCWQHSTNDLTLTQARWVHWKVISPRQTRVRSVNKTTSWFCLGSTWDNMFNVWNYSVHGMTNQSLDMFYLQLYVLFYFYLSHMTIIVVLVCLGHHYVRNLINTK